MKRYVRPQSDSKKTSVFIAVAATLMLAVNYGMWEFQASSSSPVEIVDTDWMLENSEVRDFSSAQTIMSRMEPSRILKNQTFLHLPHPEPILNKTPEITKPKRQAWKDHAVMINPSQEKAKIIIIIDDMGMDRKRSYEAMNLPAPLTLAFLPYAPKLDEITKEARKKGHELLIHTPMEPLNEKLNPGPMALRKSMSNTEIEYALKHILDSFEGYVGINNHMGSKLTQDKEVMGRVMNILAHRGLIFVDSKTIHTSVAGDIAASHGLDYAERDVFLDHHDNDEFVHDSLLKLEQVAKRKGYAIAIGHPKDSTIAALKEWLPTLEERGFSVVPVSAVVKKNASSFAAKDPDVRVQ